jgi:hypothetical protein
MGKWYHNFGSLELTQVGNKITGTFTDALTNKSSPLEASLDGVVLRGTYNNGQAFAWNLSPDLKTFNGVTSNGLRWCGAKEGVSFAEGCSFSGTWISASRALGGRGSGNVDPDNCQIKLTRVDNTVKGTYCNGELLGRFEYKNGRAVFSGELKKTGGTLPAPGTPPVKFFFLLTSIESQQFSGSATSGDGKNSQAWCGWRSGLTKPEPCEAKP